MFKLFSKLDKSYVVFLLWLAVFLSLFVVIPKVFNKGDYYGRSQIYCYHLRGDSLQDIAEDPPKPYNSIFFIDSTCVSFMKKRIYLPPRQICAVEAAARQHPQKDVYVMFTAPAIMRFDGSKKDDRNLHVLLSYDNIKLRHVNYEEFITDTPIEVLSKTEQYYLAPNSMIQVNQILRILTLWKYGGIFLDLNMLTLKNLTELGDEFVGVMSNDHVGNNVFALTSGLKGLYIASSLMREVTTMRETVDWETNGLTALTRLLKHRCPAKNVHNLTTECRLLPVYPKETFYPIETNHWLPFFDPKQAGFVGKLLEKSYTMQLINAPLNVSQNTPYMKLLKNACPRTYESAKGDLLDNVAY